MRDFKDERSTSRTESVEEVSVESTSIFRMADECDKLFDKLSQPASQMPAPHPPQASPAEKVPLDRRVGEFHSRFRAWASYLGVFAAEHLNLDARLREQPGLADIVLLTLDKLRANLQQRKSRQNLHCRY